MPDTQNEPIDRFEAQTAWLVDNAERLNLRLVVHIGDVVNDGWDETEWAAAEMAMGYLGTQVPYLIAPGNHDLGTRPPPPDSTVSTARDRTTYLQDYFSLDLFEAMPTFGGVYEEDMRVDNSYHLLRAGDEDWLVMALEFGPRDTVVQWANEVLGRYPDHRAILATHAFLYTDGQRYDWAKFGEDQLWNPHHYPIAAQTGGVHDGEELWNALIVPHPNVAAVLCGHAFGNGSRGGARNFENGVAQLFANYQDEEFGGNGYLRLMHFDPATRQVEVTTYSPFLDAFREDEGRNHFSFAY